MNHQKYQDLLFSDQELSHQESVALQEHLQKCDSCYEFAVAWGEVENQLREAPMIAPQPLFTERWQATMEKEIVRNTRKQNRVMLGITWGAAALFLMALLVFGWPLLHSPKVLILAYLYQFIGTLSVVNVVWEVGSAFLQGILNGVSPIWLVVLASMVIELFVLWVVSIRYLSKPRRVTL